MRIRYIDPVSDSSQTEALAAHIKSCIAPGTSIEIVTLPEPGRPYDNLEYDAFGAFTAKDIVHLTHDAQQNGFDGVVIGCFYDPYLHEAREVSGSAIVTAPCLATTQLAVNVASEVGLVLGRRKHWGPVKRLLHEYSAFHAVSSVSYTDQSVTDIATNKETAFESLHGICSSAIEKDNAEAIILACTMYYGIASQLSGALGIPVIDPVAASIKHAEWLCNAGGQGGIKPSRIGTHEPPPESELDRLFDNQPVPIGQKTLVE